MLGEDDPLADFTADAVPSVLDDEAAGEALGADVGHDVARIDAAPRLVDGVGVEVGRVHLQRGPRLGRQAEQHLLEHDGPGVGLFSRGAGRHPDPQRPAAPEAADELGERLLAQMVPEEGITKEAGHSDEQLLEQDVELLGARAQEAQVLAHAGEVMEGHPALDSPLERPRLVEREVGARTVAEEEDDLVEGALDVCLAHGPREPRLSQLPDVAEDARGQLLRRSDEVHDPRVDGAPGHHLVLGGLGGLRECQSTLLANGTQPEDSIGVHPREQDADGGLFLIVGQGAKEEVDGEAMPAWLRRLEHAQDPVEQREVLVGRDGVDVIGLERGAVHGLADLQARRAPQQLGQGARVRRVEVLDDDEGEPRVLRHRPEQLLERAQTARRAADADHAKPTRGAPFERRWGRRGGLRGRLGHHGRRPRRDELTS